MSRAYDTTYSDLFAHLQATQDQLADQTGLCLVLTDQRATELTLPSGLPLECSAREHPQYSCRESHTELIRQIDERQDYVLARCPYGLYHGAMKTFIRTTNGPVYLLFGRTEDRKALDDHVELLRSVFILPFETLVLPEEPPRTPAEPAVVREEKAPTRFSLTPQERRVLSCVVEGLSNKEIARRLFISHSTVKAHVANILRKLQVSNRTEASVYALKYGLTRDDEAH